MGLRFPNGAARTVRGLQQHLHQPGDGGHESRPPQQPEETRNDPKLSWEVKGQVQHHGWALAQLRQGPGVTKDQVKEMRGHWYSQSHFAVTHCAASSSIAKPITGRVTTGNSDAFMAVSISYWHADRLFMQICAQHSHNKAHFQAFWLERGNPWSHQGPEDEGSVLGGAGTLPHPEGSQGVPHTPHGLLLPPAPCYLPLFSPQKLGDFYFFFKRGGGDGIGRGKLM